MLFYRPDQWDGLSQFSRTPTGRRIADAWASQGGPSRSRTESKSSDHSSSSRENKHSDDKYGDELFYDAATGAYEDVDRHHHMHDTTSAVLGDDSDIDMMDLGVGLTDSPRMSSAAEVKSNKNYLFRK